MPMRSSVACGPAGASCRPSGSSTGSQPSSGASGVIFDAPNVLYDATLWRRWLWRLVNQLGVSLDFDRFDGDWTRDFADDVCCGRREYTEAFQAFLLARGLSWAQVDEVEAASRIQRHSLDMHLRPLAGVAKTLADISALGLPLLAWGDVHEPAPELTRRLQRLALAGYFRAVLTSFDLECAQPAPRCYEAAVDALGISADRAVYVGHNQDHLAGARAAGLRTVAFNFQPTAQADCFLTRFEDLLTVVKAWPIGSSGGASHGPDPSARGAPLLLQGGCR